MPARADGVGTGDVTGRKDGAVEAHRLPDGPGLERTAARVVRRAAIGDFRQMTEPGRIQVFEKGIEKA